jgi:hypothetical protein
LQPDSAVISTNAYTDQNLRCEEMIQQSWLTWAIYWFADIVPLKAQKPTKFMFKIPLQTHMEFIHSDDAALVLLPTE